MVTVTSIKKELFSCSNPTKAKVLSNFFKTGKGEYGEGDKFLGITVPQQRKVAKRFVDLSLKDLQKIITSEYHEFRLTSLLILTYKIEKFRKQISLIIQRRVGSKSNDFKELVDKALSKDYEYLKIVDFLLKNKKYINNWDLVDITVPIILGPYYFYNKAKQKELYKLASSNDLWSRRIAILTTFYFIRQGDFQDTVKMAEMNLVDSRDLIQKATGWMLREIGKRDEKVLIEFLDKNAHKMPRTILRYSIERLSNTLRNKYMSI